MLIQTFKKADGERRSRRHRALACIGDGTLCVPHRRLISAVSRSYPRLWLLRGGGRGAPALSRGTLEALREALQAVLALLLLGPEMDAEVLPPRAAHDLRDL